MGESTLVLEVGLADRVLDVTQVYATAPRSGLEVALLLRWSPSDEFVF